LGNASDLDEILNILAVLFTLLLRVGFLIPAPGGKRTRQLIGDSAEK